MDAREEQARAAETAREQQRAEEPGWVESSPGAPGENYDHLSWNRFFDLIHGSVCVGYEVDEDGRWTPDHVPGMNTPRERRGRRGQRPNLSGPCCTAAAATVVHNNCCHKLVATFSECFTMYAPIVTILPDQEESRKMKLIEVRRQAGYGRPKASRLCDMDYVALYRIETGERVPRIETVMKISGALGLDPWQVDEFLPALRKAEAAGLLVRPTEGNMISGASGLRPERGL